MLMLAGVTMNLVDHMMSSFPSFVDECHSDTLQAVTLLDILFEVSGSMFSDGLLLNPNKEFELSHLCS